MNRDSPMRDPAEGISAEGMIVTGARRDRVPQEFEPVLSAMAEQLSATAGEVSLYVYGSVATGTARAGSSDIDFLTLGLSAVRAKDLGTAMSDQFAAVCRGVELAPAQPGDLVGDEDEAYGNRVFLRHYCVHLQGPDRQAGLSPFRADARAARGFNGDIARHLVRWRQRASEADQTVAALGRGVARKTLLAVAGLVSVHDTTWTTDREGAAQRWSVIDPSLAGPLANLLAWSEGRRQPVTEQLHAALAAGGVVDRVARAFESSIGLWPDCA
jgi:Nucleotidyltransferase domain.